MFRSAFAFVLALLCAVLCLPACSPLPVESRTFYGYCNTDITLTLAAPYGLDRLFGEAEDILRAAEECFSRTATASELAKVNASEEENIILSDGLALLLERALAYAEESDGCFDPTAGILTDLFDIGGDAPLPNESEVAEARKKVNFRTLSLEGNLLVRPVGTVIDLGAVAKGYIASLLSRALLNGGAAYGVISVGGNIAVFGEKPNGAPFRIGLRSPFKEGPSVLGSLSLTETAYISTSGAYERYRTDENGRVYHHIFDPATGYPAVSDLASVTVISQDGARADALSTALFVMGSEKALAYLASRPELGYILVGHDGSIHRSPHLDFTQTP